MYTIKGESQHLLITHQLCRADSAIGLYRLPDLAPPINSLLLRVPIVRGNLYGHAAGGGIHFFHWPRDPSRLTLTRPPSSSWVQTLMPCYTSVSWVRSQCAVMAPEQSTKRACIGARWTVPWPNWCAVSWPSVMLTSAVLFTQRCDCGLQCHPAFVTKGLLLLKPPIWNETSPVVGRTD